MSEFVAAAMGQGEGLAVAIGQATQVRRQIEQALGDEMDDIALALDFAVDRQQPGAEYDASLLLE